MPTREPASASRRIPRRLLVTGGAGFIGSHFVRRVLARHPDVEVTVLDKLTYAGNLANLADVEADPRYHFVRGDIADPRAVDPLARDADAIVNLAAESHVDRSIDEPDEFIQTDIHGTFVLLEAARRHGCHRFLQVSTDEVYGSVLVGVAGEGDPMRPSSPYAASKAGGDLLLGAYQATYDLPAMITRSTNNFGPNQYTEKVIPLFVTNALDGLPLPVYGDGLQIREWLYVTDHCDALETILAEGEPGAVYNVGSGEELTNLELAQRILDLTGRPRSLVEHVEDRPGHDRRYAVDSTRVRSLGWAPVHALDAALQATVEWYRTHESWWRPLKSGAYLAAYRRQLGSAQRRRSGT
ncbi:MAG TPA: dTDP-glucose 4,6-dehydratase [Candidatus Limnocylindria bacterium]|nr:dTDP-glucose 4,6-dehydratase [Candidatus Limnocylindria bacterium]